MPMILCASFQKGNTGSCTKDHPWGIAGALTPDRFVWENHDFLKKFRWARIARDDAGRNL